MTQIQQEIPRPKKAHPGLILILLLIIFLGPFGFALNMHKKENKINLRHNNIGDLIVPVKQARDLEFTNLNSQEIFTGEKLAGKWQFLYVPSLSCDENCHDTINMMGQIHQSLNKSAPRLKRMLVLVQHPESEYQQYNQKYRLKMQNYDKTLGLIGDKTKRDLVGEFYVIDPKGNIMMYYTGDTPGKGILKDLNKLMKAS